MTTFLPTLGSGFCPETFTVTLADMVYPADVFNGVHTITANPAAPCRWEKDLGGNYFIRLYYWHEVPCWRLILDNEVNWPPYTYRPYLYVQSSNLCDARGAYTNLQPGFSTCVVS